MTPSDLATLLPLLAALLVVVGGIIGIVANDATIHEWYINRGLRKYLKREPTECEWLGFGLLLRITDPESTVVRHVMTRRIKNISKKPLEQHVVFLFGDVARRWEDLNLRLYWEDGTPIDLKEINRDTPTHKEFTIELKPPLYPDEDRLYAVEWDWDEPKRYFEYTFVTRCKSAEVELVFPATKKYEFMVYDVSHETREKRASEVRPRKPMIIGKEAKIMWARDKIEMNSVVRFEWRELKSGG